MYNSVNIQSFHEKIGQKNFKVFHIPFKKKYLRGKTYPIVLVLFSIMCKIKISIFWHPDISKLPRGS